MKHLLSAIVVAAAAVTSLGISTPALASCVQQTTAEQIARADIVVHGTLTGIRMTFAPASPVVTFRPERVLKGSLDTIVEVFLGPTHGGAVTSVDYNAAPPQAHTLYLRLRDGAYETDGCSGSHEGAPTADEEKLMGPGVLVGAADHTSVPLAIVAGLALAVVAVVAVTIVTRRRPARP